MTVKMKERQITEQEIAAFEAALKERERSSGTIEKYLRDVRALNRWLGGTPVTKERIGFWRESLLKNGYAAVTVNSMLAAANSFFQFLGWDECRVKFLRIQRRAFREQSRELTRKDYEKLLATAQVLGKSRLHLLIETICATGIRVSELQYITVEAAEAGSAQISLKGKIRTIMIPGKLCRKLLKYAKKQKTASGEIFLTKSGKSISRCQIWREMKWLCRHAGVEASRVFPHNLRHLFATEFYRISRDIVKLADVLGHASINTTRLYLITTGREHIRQLEQLRLVS